MAKKSKVAVEEVKATKSNIRVDDISALLSGAGVHKEAKKEAKSSVPEVPIEDDDLKQEIHDYMMASAKEKAAKAMKELVGEEIRPSAHVLYLECCRKTGIYHKTICLGSEMNFGSIQLAVAKPDKKSGRTADSIEGDLQRMFGEDFQTYFTKTHSLSIKAVTVENVKFLMEQLGADKFKELFTHSEDLSLTEVGGGEDKIVLLRKDSIMDKKVAVTVADAISHSLLTENAGALTPQKGALAIVEKEILEDAQGKKENGSGVKVEVTTKAS